MSLVTMVATGTDGTSDDATHLLDFVVGANPTFGQEILGDVEPAGKPREMLPPSHQGLSTRSKACRRRSSGRAASATRWVDAYGRMSR